MWMFITSKNKYLSNDMKIFGTCSIPLRKVHENILQYVVSILQTQSSREIFDIALFDYQFLIIILIYHKI